jgi:3,5-epimerase/4-reductase
MRVDASQEAGLDAFSPPSPLPRHPHRPHHCPLTRAHLNPFCPPSRSTRRPLAPQDWCEDHKDEVMRVNVVGTLGLLDACEKRGIHITNFATGCIFNYDDKYVVGGEPIPEDYPANYVGSFYSLTKGMVDALSPNFKNALTLRLRMPISDDLSGRNFITKIASYNRVINVPNSVSILHDLLPVSLAMADRKITGTFNFTNPGTMSHNECLALYKVRGPL